MIRFCIRLLAAITLVTGSSIGAGVQAYELYASVVSLAPTAGDGNVLVETDGSRHIPILLLAHVGKPVKAHVQIKVGWGTYPDRGGSALSFRSAITQPEYTYFCPREENCDIYAETGGISFDQSTGVVSGTPRRTGIFYIYPAARDKVNGESPYHGQGAWFATYTEFGGKTWIESTTKYGILVLPQSKNRVSLQCNVTQGNHAPIFITLDYDASYVEVLGNTGSIAGVYRINPNADIIGWSTLPRGTMSPYSNGVTLDRNTGIMTVSIERASSMQAQCSKRSTARKF